MAPGFTTVYPRGGTTHKHNSLLRGLRVSHSLTYLE
ncbi:hypothetical protein Mal64_25800 [Pseudobythopirellula maris]|uniref:Uncharacterized protein n=1 Tax=Pseudobythopirellula maris TaxID=2527991 RepID=A0A5C5ZPR5_9BACT|nr:hypothetical protein Mal64_25800 [Pseudobythopirellula maris]